MAGTRSRHFPYLVGNVPSGSWDASRDFDRSNCWTVRKENAHFIRDRRQAGTRAGNTSVAPLANTVTVRNAFVLACERVAGAAHRTTSPAAEQSRTGFRRDPNRRSAETSVRSRAGAIFGSAGHRAMRQEVRATWICMTFYRFSTVYFLQS